MKFYSTLHIGAFHLNHCEDFLIYEQIGTNESLIAVMDGCTMGNESVFASVLLGKILRNLSKKMFYQEFIAPQEGTIEVKLKEVLKLLISETKAIKNQLGLEKNDLLSTLIIGIIDTNNAKAELLTIGDGLICVDGVLTEYDQGNIPDYLAYHLSEDFDSWYDSIEQRKSISQFRDLSICTDGIFTFKNFENKYKEKAQSEIINYLLIDREWEEFDNFLDRKVRCLKDNDKHHVTDDLAIVRVLNKK